ncbi:substrate-binding domain-containing protein [Planctomycetota bacterium]
MHKAILATLAMAAVAAGLGCSREEQRLRLATTTSTENSGLLAALLPPFERQHGVKVDVIAVGTGKALKLGENDDVDVVLVHARAAEEKFVADGFGVKRVPVMHNDFVVVGPKEDPAGLEAARTAAEAFTLLAAGKASFISRGDDSGTHKKEKELWKAAGVEPDGAWYVSTGQAMGAVLRIADEKRACALTDRGTYLAHAARLDLVVLVEGDAALHNPYGVIAVSPNRHPQVKHALAAKLIDYLTSAEGQGIIAGYKVNGKQLFFPDALEQE